MRVVFRSDQLKRARLRKKLTQEDLAAQCNTSDRYIRDLEREFVHYCDSCGQKLNWRLVSAHFKKADVSL